LNIISTKISKPSFDTWIKNTKGETEGDILKIYCQNSFQKDWLEERYHNLFCEVVEKVFGKECEIKYVFDEGKQ
jgi:chromosomal replication initiator protein